MLHAEARTRVGEVELDAALAVAPGRCLALLGTSGAGKTTLLRIVAGLHRPRDGRVTCDGSTWLDTERGVDVAPERRRCGLVFQDYALFGHLSARANVAYGLRGRNRGERAQAWLERLGVAHAAARRPRELSGGERQRLALARALAPQPRVLLLDEPLAALDARTRADAGAVLREALGATEVPSVLVTHDFTEASVLGDEVAVLDSGRIVQHGTAAELAAAPASAVVAALTGAVVLTGTARPEGEGLTAVALDGGGVLHSTDARTGAVAAVLYPWEIALEPIGGHGPDSARNRLAAEVTALTPLGNRVRVGLRAGQPLTAEVTAQAAAELGLAPGARVTASWKATATRLVAR